MRAAASLLLLSGCGALTDLDNQPPPLGIVKVELAPGFADFVDPAIRTRLRLGVLWAAAPYFVPYCHEYGPTPLDPDRRLSAVGSIGCRDPFGVIPARLGQSVRIDPTQSAQTLALTQLPPAEVLVGTVNSRVGYGSIVVFDDKDGDGDLFLPRACGRRGFDDGDEDPTERIFAASFLNLTEDQTRLVYSEGQFDRASYFYPHSGCAEMPGPGFSIWKMGDYLYSAGGCTLSGLDEVVALVPLDRSETKHLGCRQDDDESFSRPPPRRGLALDKLHIDCLGDTKIAVADEGCSCPEVRVFSLRGCYDQVDEECENPDWDLTQFSEELEALRRQCNQR